MIRSRSSLSKLITQSYACKSFGAPRLKHIRPETPVVINPDQLVQPLLLAAISIIVHYWLGV